ncbi:MAG: deoxynucleoside kinase, partial [Pseudomonadales bacterium]|nr:deoxynucleoside kinase [Pseudomonadales bacterium]
MKKSIAIAGNIGSGKSTLLEFLANNFEIQPFYEPNATNPYLPSFYEDMSAWAFHSQLYFLANKFKLHQALDQAPGVVALDRTIFEDAEIFATAL